MMSKSNFPGALSGVCRGIKKASIGSQGKIAALAILIPLVLMMMGTGEEDASSTRQSSALTPETGSIPGSVNGACRGEFGGYCVPVGSCLPENKIQANQESCDAGLECCTKELNMKLCASRGGECVDIGSCGEGVALFREAEDCNRARHGRDCCIWM